MAHQNALRDNGEMKIALLMARGVELMEVSAFIDVFGWHRRLSGSDLEVHTVAAAREVASSSGLAVPVSRLLGEVRAEDYAGLGVPGAWEAGDAPDDAESPAALELIRAFAAAERPIAAVSMGALQVAKAGILRGRRATTYHLRGWQTLNNLAALGAEVVMEPVVLDQRIVTSWCPSTAFEVAFSLLTMVSGPQATLAVRALMGF